MREWLTSKSVTIHACARSLDIGDVIFKKGVIALDEIEDGNHVA